MFSINIDVIDSKKILEDVIRIIEFMKWYILLSSVNVLPVNSNKLISPHELWTLCPLLDFFQ